MHQDVSCCLTKSGYKEPHITSIECMIFISMDETAVSHANANLTLRVDLPEREVDH
jgi:hypothetical protein